MNRFSGPLKNSPSNSKGPITNNNLTSDITGEDVHYWPSQLNFRAESDKEGGCSVVSGLIDPRPAV